MTKGFTLLEMLITLGVIGILLSISFTALGRFRDLSELQQTQQLIVQEINRARSEVYKTGISYSVSWTADKLKIVGNSTKEIDFSSSDRVKIISKPDSVSYAAPYGTTLAVPKTIELKTKSGRLAEVLIYGVTGKVFSH